MQILKKVPAPRPNPLLHLRPAARLEHGLWRRKGKERRGGASSVRSPESAARAAGRAGARCWRHRRRLLSGRQEWKAREVLFRAGVGISRAFRFASPGSALSPSGWLWGGGLGCVAFRECERWGSVVARSPTSAFLWLLAGFGLPWPFTSLGPAFRFFLAS